MKYLLKKLFCIFLLSSVHGTNAVQINVRRVDNVEEHVLQELKNLFVDAFSQAYKHIDIKDIHNNFDTISDYLQSLFDSDHKNIENLNFDFIVATEEKEIIGYVLSCYCAKEKIAYIHHLVVATSNQSKGIGRMLIKECENVYQEAQFVSLSTRTFNDKAIGFYKHLGFYEVNFAPEVAYRIRPHAKNNPHIVNLEKRVTRD